MTARRPAPLGPRVVVAVAVAIGLVAVARVGRAAEGDEAPPPSTWHFEAQPYGWLSGTFGRATVKGNALTIDVSPSDVYQLLEDGNAFSAAGYFALGYDRFSVFVDAVGGYAEVGVNETIPTPLCCSISIRARDEIKFVINDAALGYELGRWSLPGRKRPLTLGVYAGARSMWFSNKVSAKAGVVGGVQKAADVFDSFAWSDPLMGVRWSLPVWDPVSLDFRADIGGFGASSQLIWGIASAVRVWLPWHPLSVEPFMSLGYRVVDFDRSSSAGDINLQYRGPTAGAGFTF